MPVEPRLGDPSLVQRLDPFRRALSQLVEVPELDRVGRARLRAGGLEPVVQPVVTHRALPRAAIAFTTLDHTVWAGRNAVAAAVANVLLHNDVPNSVRNSAPVGHTSRQPACVQCLQTSLLISQRKSVRLSTPDTSPGRSSAGMPRSIGSRLPASSLLACAGCSMNATCRQEFAPRSPVLSNDIPSRLNPSSGTSFHS